MEYIKTVGQTPSPQIMEQPPEYITTKDLAYLKDALSWELTAMKKCYCIRCPGRSHIKVRGNLRFFALPAPLEWKTPALGHCK